MSLNWVEIDKVLQETALEGAFLQNAKQSDFHNLILEFHKPGQSTKLLISLAQGKTRLHPLTLKMPTLPKPPRFVQFLRANVTGSKVLLAQQLGQERLVCFELSNAGGVWNLWIRLWGGAANVLITDKDNIIQEAMFRRPDSREVKGEIFDPRAEQETLAAKKNPERVFALRDLPGEGSYGSKLEAFYAQEQGENLDRLRQQVNRQLEGRLSSAEIALEKISARLTEYDRLEDFKTYGDMINAFAHSIKKGDPSLVQSDFRDGAMITIPLDPELSPQENAQKYFKKYTKARDGRQYVVDEIAEIERLIASLKNQLSLVEEMTGEQLKSVLSSHQKTPVRDEKNPRPGLEFHSGPFTIIVGRTAKENDELLRRYVKGNDLWLHTRDVSGGYVFIKNLSGKTIPLEVLLDAGNLAVFYSKAKTQGQADLYYTPVKYLRRAKDGPLGLVLPTQEKNLLIKIDSARLKRLQNPEEV